METLVSYLKKVKNSSFKEEKLNELDVAFLSMLAYGKFERLGILSLKLKSVPYKILLEQVKIFEDIYNFDETFDLADYIKTSKRFGNIWASNVMSKFSAKQEEQFLGVLFKITHRRYVIAYRGTDRTKTGWKENLNMSLGVVPAQKSAVEYFRKTIKKHPLSKFIITGHSKGGNLSYYTMLNSTEKEKSKVVRCFNFDGPGFSELQDATLLNGKGIKIIPQDSLIGVLLNNTRTYSVVHSEGARLEQHNLFRWEVDLVHKCFIRQTERSEFSQKFESIINNWIFSLTADERKTFISEIFEIIERRADPGKEFIDKVNTKGILFEALKKNNFALRKSILTLGKIYHFHKKELKKESSI